MILIHCTHALLFILLSYDTKLNCIGPRNQRHALFLPLEEGHPLLDSITMQ